MDKIIDQKHYGSGDNIANDKVVSNAVPINKAHPKTRKNGLIKWILKALSLLTAIILLITAIMSLINSKSNENAMTNFNQVHYGSGDNVGGVKSFLTLSQSPLF